MLITSNVFPTIDNARIKALVDICYNNAIIIKYAMIVQSNVQNELFVQMPTSKSSGINREKVILNPYNNELKKAIETNVKDNFYNDVNDDLVFLSADNDMSVDVNLSKFDNIGNGIVAMADVIIDRRFTIKNLILRKKGREEYQLVMPTVKVNGVDKQCIECSEWAFKKIYDKIIEQYIKQGNEIFA